LVGSGGSLRSKPESVSILEVSKKKVNNKKLMSAMEDVFNSGIFFAMAMVYLFRFLIEKNIKMRKNNPNKV
jgi:hypothetical protein